ncbi:chemotaxis protein CheA [Alkalimarinus alittae]|uniref:histidine kinase n=1 Tax=Alkalimarinus alittae TaxID=2961619 RepID=A0ABY6MYM1_9ALTE|nr:chemotaxis protein CheA [Alkalimarinus alittae]UZE94936.1 chemotaxis protein CheA [Alkalimarinus alittae]
MGFEADEEILQDFLVESGEILELLSEQLVDLEQNPDDTDLLNAIFRGFHTVKGGAGFLQLDALVECCHVAENVFDILRNGKRRVDAELMDVVLQALDVVNEMFDQCRNREELVPANPALIEALAKLAVPEVAGAAVSDDTSITVDEAPSVDNAPEDGDITDDEFEQLLNALDSPETPSDATSNVDAPSVSSDDEITDEEFEKLLDDLHGTGKHSSADDNVASELAAPESGEITDDEFERLLDDLHGKGQFKDEVASGGASTPADAPSTGAPASDESSDVIDDSEFDKLLDDLHGQGKGPTVGGSKPTPESKPKPEPAPKAAPKPAAPVTPAAAKKPASKEQSIATETTVRVDTKRLDDIMNMVGELVLVRNRLKRLGDESENEAMHKAVSNLDVVTGDLQSAVMQTRMQPIKKVFGRFPRVVRDLARNLKKEVNLVLKGEDTDLDKNLVEALSDPLVHLVRNAVDHGVELPDIREANGKPRIGQVILAAEQEGDHILLSIKDDGAGMDPDVLRRKAVEKGLFDEDAAERLTDTECFNLIFAPGFSTKVEISDVSGRGVGMDVVKTKITQLNGTIAIDSVLGSGSHIVIKVPLTLAIMPTLMVLLDDQSFAFPLVSVVEIFHLDLSSTNIVDGQECVVVRDNVYPLFHIKRWLVKGTPNQPEAESAHVVIVSVGTKRVGFVVDQLVGQEEVVIKPLGRMLHGTPGMSGATITGDGRIALILDIPSLLQRYA